MTSWQALACYNDVITVAEEEGVCQPVTGLQSTSRQDLVALQCQVKPATAECSNDY